MAEVKSANDDTEQLVAQSVAVQPAKPNKSRPTREKSARSGEPSYYTVEAAATKLSLDPAALRARLRRAQRAEADAVVADLGGGIRGFKFGKSWRIRFPEA
jgi:hypothetical protein